jgi:AraC-like DNA-binding protein
LAFVWHTVSPPLSAYVNCLYLADEPAPYARDAIFPLPAIDVKFNFGEPWRVLARDSGAADTMRDFSWVLGIWNRHHVIEWPERMQFLGISFKPLGAYAFLGVPLSEVHNSIVPLDAILGPLAAEAAERLHAATTPEQRFAIAEEILITRMRDRLSSSRIVAYAAKQISVRHGAVRIGELCDEIGVSRKHLITLFRRMVGCTPKELARLHRFEHALHSIDADRPVDWTAVAHENDYFDQSHFIHDFEAYTGLSPSAYLKLRRTGRERPNHASILGMPAAG